MSKRSPRPAVASASVQSSTGRSLTRRLAIVLRGVALTGGLLGFALSGTGCSRDPGPEDFSSRMTITIQPDAATLGNFGFTPNPANIAIDTQVIWVNRDDVNHRIVSTGGFFDSGPIKPGQSYQLIFREAGTFRYYDEAPGSTIQGVLNVIN